MNFHALRAAVTAASSLNRILWCFTWAWSITIFSKLSFSLSVSYYRILRPYPFHICYETTNLPLDPCTSQFIGVYLLVRFAASQSVQSQSVQSHSKNATHMQSKTTKKNTENIDINTQTRTPKSFTWLRTVLSEMKPCERENVRNKSKEWKSIEKKPNGIQ